MNLAFPIRRLTAEDAALYRAIRLEALERNPEAFGSTLEREAVEPLAFFAGRLTGSAVFGAFNETEIVGSAGVYFLPSMDAPETATLWTVYVRPAARGAGIGRRLVEAAIGHAGERLERIGLDVNAENRAALALYRRLGFVETGMKTGSLQRGGRVYDEVTMEKRLR